MLQKVRKLRETKKSCYILDNCFLLWQKFLHFLTKTGNNRTLDQHGGLVVRYLKHMFCGSKGSSDILPSHSLNISSLHRNETAWKWDSSFLCFQTRLHLKRDLILLHWCIGKPVGRYPGLVLDFTDILNPCMTRFLFSRSGSEAIPLICLDQAQWWIFGYLQMNLLRALQDWDWRYYCLLEGDLVKVLWLIKQPNPSFIPTNSFNIDHWLKSFNF